MPPMAAAIAHIFMSLASFNITAMGGSRTSTAAMLPIMTAPSIIPRAVKKTRTILFSKLSMLSPRTCHSAKDNLIMNILPGEKIEPDKEPVSLMLSGHLRLLPGSFHNLLHIFRCRVEKYCKISTGDECQYCYTIVIFNKMTCRVNAIERMGMMTEKATAGDIMTREVVTVTPGDDVEKVARLLLERRISGLPVVDGEGKVVGIISEGDMVIQQEEIKAPVYTNILGGIIYLERPQRFMEDLKRHIAQKVGDLMSGRVHTVVPETPVEKVATMMVEKGINRVPVVDGDQKLLGIITRQDVIKAAYRG